MARSESPEAWRSIVAGLADAHPDVRCTALSTLSDDDILQRIPHLVETRRWIDSALGADAAPALLRVAQAPQVAIGT